MEKNIFIQRRKAEKKKYFITGAVLVVMLIVTVIISVGKGAMNIPFSDTAGIIFGKIFSSDELLQNFKDNEIAVVWEIRLPRILCGCAVGAGLACSGVIFQSILQNPLSDPYTLGISTGASFGASLALLFNMLYSMALPVEVFAFVFALATLILVISIAHKGGGLISSNLIIAGIIVSSIFSSGISFIKMVAGENVSAIVYWLMGSLSSKGWEDFSLCMPVITICIIISTIFSSKLNIMAMGNSTASALGVNVKALRTFYLVTGAVITAVCVSVCGIIGFVGLIVPHILRFWITSDNRFLMPLSAVFGALLLCISDTAARLISQGEIPVGIFTTLLGGPFFIYIFMKRRKGGTNEQ